MASVTPKKDANGRKRFTPQQVAEALHASYGNVLMAAQSLGIARNNLYPYLAEYPECQQACDEGREARLDGAEHLLTEASHGRTDPTRSQLTAAIFTLKTIGKKRGYIERQELTGADGGPVDVRVVRFSDA